MSHSPLGAPASYAAVKKTEKPHRAILKGLRKTKPKVKGAGIDRDPRKGITGRTPPRDRIDANTLNRARQKVHEGYGIDAYL